MNFQIFEKKSILPVYKYKFHYQKILSWGKIFWSKIRSSDEFVIFRKKNFISILFIYIPNISKCIMCHVKLQLCPWDWYIIA